MILGLLFGNRENSSPRFSRPARRDDLGILVNYDNGHFTEEKSVTFRNFATQYAFVLWQAGHKDFQPPIKSVQVLSSASKTISNEE